VTGNIAYIAARQVLHDGDFCAPAHHFLNAITTSQHPLGTFEIRCKRCHQAGWLQRCQMIVREFQRQRL
jgi:hypothetical protein